MENINRRALLKILSAVPVAASFALTDAEAQQAHHLAETARQVAKKAGVAYTPKFFTPAEYQTVRVLSDLIIPADERSGGAIDAGVPEFMDFTMVDQPARQVAMRGGLAWLDLECQRRFDKTFVGASDGDRHAVLRDIATHHDVGDDALHAIDRQVRRFEDEMARHDVRDFLVRRDGSGAARSLQEWAQVRGKVCLGALSNVARLWPQPLVWLYNLRRALRAHGGSRV